MNDGFDLTQAGKYDLAAEKFKEVLKVDMNNPFALNNLAAIEEQKGHYREAMAFLQQATAHANDYLAKGSPDLLCGRSLHRGETD